jgi:hypothetical protein
MMMVFPEVWRFREGRGELTARSWLFEDARHSERDEASLSAEEPNPVISTSTERNQSMAHPSLWRAAASFSSSSWPLHILTNCHLSNFPICIFPLFYCILGVLLQHMKEFCLSSSHKLSFWHYYSLQPCKVMYFSWWKKLEHSWLPFSLVMKKWIELIGFLSQILQRKMKWSK